MTQVTAARPVETADIRRFQINIPEEELVDLRRRIESTRFPENETISDFSQGVQLFVNELRAGFKSLR